MRSSSPRKTLTVVLGLLIGLMVGGGLAFVQAFIDQQRQDDEERQKLEEIQQAISNAMTVGRIFRWRQRRTPKT